MRNWGWKTLLKRYITPTLITGIGSHLVFTTEFPFLRQQKRRFAPKGNPETPKKMLSAVPLEWFMCFSFFKRYSCWWFRNPATTCWGWYFIPLFTTGFIHPNGGAGSVNSIKGGFRHQPTKTKQPKVESNKKNSDHTERWGSPPLLVGMFSFCVITCVCFVP